MKFDDLHYDDPADFKNLLVVDGLNLAFRWKHSGAKTFAVNYLNVVESLAKSYEAKNIIVLGDWGSAYRKEIYPEYKANREVLKENQTEEERKAFEDFLNEFNKACELINNKYLFIRKEGVEADDIAAFIVKHYSKDFEHTWLISSDKDWDLLIADDVSRFSYVTRKEITKNDWSEHYDYDIEDHISIKVLAGDKGDNVPGIEGVGPKRAYGLIRQYGTAMDIYSALPLSGKQKFIQNTNTFGEQFLINYELMDLQTYCEEALLDQFDGMT